MPPRLYTLIIRRLDGTWVQFSYRAESPSAVSSEIDEDWLRMVIIEIDNEPIKPIQFTREVREVK